MLKNKYKGCFLPVFAFFSKSAYREVGREWKGNNFAYIFLLLAVCCLVPTLELRNRALDTLGANQRYIINQLPDIHIRNGHVLLNQTQPLFIRKDNGTPVAVIDTTGSMNFIYNENVNVLLTENKLIIRRGKNTFNSLDLSQVTSFDLTKDLLYEWLKKAGSILTPITYASVLVFAYVLTTLVMVLTAFIGLFISSAMHTSLGFHALLRIGATAAMPSIILLTVSSALGIMIPRLAYIACILTYLLMGIRACRHPAGKEALPRLQLDSLLHDDKINSSAA